MNSVQLLGRLAQDPELRFTKTGRAVATFTVATSRSYVDQAGEQKEMSEFTRCVAWGKLGESVGNALRKGSRCFVEGRITTRSYDAQDGSKRYITEVVANFVGQELGGAEFASESHAGGSNFDSFGGSSADQNEEIPF